MSRWEVDTAFYRVVCVSLLAVAIVFSLVLTDVFMDIDGLLHVKKDKIQKLQTTHKANNRPVTTITTDVTETYNTDIYNYDTDYGYRTKRSSETENLIFRMKQAKVKNILTSRLANLLDQLDAEETTEVNGKNDPDKINNVASKEIKELKDQKVENTRKKENKEQFLHSAMHEILLLGLKGHLDFNEVYERIHTLKENFDKETDIHILRSNAEPANVEELKHSIPDSVTEEQKLFDEILHCKKLKDEIAHNSVKDKETTQRTHRPKLIIKTIIDIKSLTDGKQKIENETNSKENVKGLVKLIYNGKSIKFTRLDDEKAQTNKYNKENNPKLDAEPVNIEKTSIKNDEITDLLNRYTSRAKVNYAINEYLRQYQNSEIKQKTKRLKRHIKIRYENDEVTEQPKKKKDDDELFVEIETHFDSKGMKGDKKKKLISNLVDKIQKAIHSNSDNKKELKSNDTSVKTNVKQKKHKRIHVKKRIQDPLNQNDEVEFKNKMQIPLDPMVHRHLDPIAKSVPVQEPMPYFSDKYGQNWRRRYYGPGFLGVTKSINSAEMSEVDVDYNKASMDGVSQRIQKPLNNEITDKDPALNAYYDMGKLKFFVKDIDGSGFSVGFNQYVDQQPDPEAMKLFTGIENIIQTYHQTYDQPQTENEVDSLEKNNEIHEAENDQNDHTIARRSIKSEHDHHSNEYKVVLENRFLPYENYEDILIGKKTNDDNYTENTKTINAVKNDVKSTESPFIIDEGILEKKLKPAEIFGIANLMQRKKRSINVQKISNLKNKIKLNRYLNTKAMATKRIFLSKKRSKRQAEKIRIIAKDDMPMHKHSDEIFVMSDENVLADRAIVREVETPDLEQEKLMEDHYDVIPPVGNMQQMEAIPQMEPIPEIGHMPHMEPIPHMAPIPHLEPVVQMAPMSQIPYVYEEPIDQPLVTNIFDGISRHNSLMSKYPHILLEEIARSREEDTLDNPYVYNKFIQHHPVVMPVEVTTVPVATMSNVPAPKMEELVKAITPQNAKTNYRVTVKILPKNNTDLNSGFKEIHTSINKSYNRNGLLYSSLVNVSEISKIVKINKTNEIILTTTTTTQLPIITNIRRQQETMNHILKQHKHRIEVQLNHLHREKEKLENLSMKNETEFEDGKNNEYIEVMVPSNPPKILKLTKDELSRLAVASLVKINEGQTTIAPTTTLTTSSTTELPQVDTQKVQMINKMERNENMTNEILKKIDKNTEILQLFLQKLTDKIVRQRIETDKVREDFQNIQTFKNHVPAPFNQMMPNMEATNGSHVAIPFIYAYQQPYALPVNKPEVPVASVVYHGHIHTNTINRKREWPEREPKKEQDERKTNQTKFFIDDLENDYKVVPVDVKKDSANLRNNNTGV